MKKKDLEDLKTKSKTELLRRAQEMAVDITKIKMDMKMKKVKNINDYRNKMKDRARILTIAHLMKEDKNV